MLEPREADIPVLFLVLVVLPLVAYILLGKWSDSAKKKERISLLAQLAAEEAFKAEAMAVADVVPLVASSKNGTHQCVRCSGRATTRCSRCKSVRYWSVTLQLTLLRRKSGNDGKSLLKFVNQEIQSPKGLPFKSSRADNF